MSRAPAANDNVLLGWMIVVAIIAVLALASCGKDSSGSTSNSSTAGWEAQETENAAAVAPETPLPLDKGAVQRGQGQLRTVARLELDGAEQIFSRNCYDALQKSFGWAQLDRCGGFDALAARKVSEAAEASEADLIYFQSEAAATRYLTAATNNGLPADEADLRWSSVQAAARRAALPKPAVTEAPALAKAEDTAAEVAAIANTNSLEPSLDEARGD